MNYMPMTVRQYWDANPCGSKYTCDQRYHLEPYIIKFAGFASAYGRDILEVGVGMGCDYLAWQSNCPHSLVGIDVSETAVTATKRRGGNNVRIADVTALAFANNSFDLVYSWGVLHHTVDIRSAIANIRRVLRPRGIARVMIYHKHSITGFMLWLRYGLFQRRSMSYVYASKLESPGTQAFTVREAQALFKDFSRVSVRVQLNHTDLLLGDAGAHHKSALLRVVKLIWPRFLIRLLCKRFGMYLLIEAQK